MVKRLVIHIWNARIQFVRYFATGISGLVLDMGSLYVLKEHAHMRPVWAVVINQIFILNYIFFLNKHWSFRARGITHHQMVRFFVLAGCNYTFSVGWMWVFNERFSFDPYLARLANIVLAVGWNFLLYKHWVYREPPKQVEARSQDSLN